MKQTFIEKKVLIVQCIVHSDVSPFGVVKQSLVNGSTVGCPKCKQDRHKTHGKSKSKVYHVFKRIIQRCYDPNDKDWSNYGGRGIDTDPRYNPDHNNQGIETAFTNFYNDIGDIAEHLSCDREDNSKGYWKSNIRLVDMNEQARNKRNNVMTMELANKLREEFKSGLVTYSDLSRIYNLHPEEVRRIILNKLWKE